VLSRQSTIPGRHPRRKNAKTLQWDLCTAGIASAGLFNDWDRGNETAAADRVALIRRDSDLVADLAWPEFVNQKLASRSAHHQMPSAVARSAVAAA
jgi:hypothetical protein